jgi:hypothetical protein
MINTKLKLAVTAVVGLIIGLIVLSWINSHGYIEISISGADANKQITYTFTDGKTGKTTEEKSNSSTLKILVSKSDYSVSAVQDDKSVIFLLKTSGMLKTTSRNGVITQEKARTFVGSEPNTCMIYTSFLYSYDCGDAYSTLKLHLPATAKDPSYVKNADDLSTVIRGDVTIDNKPYLITQAPDITGEGGLPTTIQAVEPSLKFSALKALKGLDADKSYGFTNYKNGFIAYEDSFEGIKYYSGVNSSPLPIPNLKPSNDNVQPVRVSVAGSQIGSFYSENFLDSEETDTELQKDTKLQKGDSEIVVYDGSRSKNFKFELMYSDGIVCGNNRVCLSSQDKMDIYDVSGDKAKHLFTMSDVKDVKYLNQKMLVISSKQLIVFDNNFVGSAVYSFGDYTYCGLSEAKSGLLACIADKDGKKYAILISASSANTDSIDKKILQLKESDAIKSLSVYKNFIHILQEAGSLEYQSALDGYGYSPDLIKAADRQINQKINDLSIDRAEYRLVLTL